MPLKPPPIKLEDDSAARDFLANYGFFPPQNSQESDEEYSHRLDTLRAEMSRNFLASPRAQMLRKKFQSRIFSLGVSTE